MTADNSPPESLRLPGAGGIELQVYDYGNAEAPPLVLVHGIQDLAPAFDPLAEKFRDRYRVVSFDLRGHGDSGKPGVYALPHFIADLHAVIFQLQLERPVLVGHSLGGHIVSHYAAVFNDVPSVVVNIDGVGAPFRESDIPVESRQIRLQNGFTSLLRPGGHKRPMNGFSRMPGGSTAGSTRASIRKSRVTWSRSGPRSIPTADCSGSGIPWSRQPR